MDRPLAAELSRVDTPTLGRIPAAHRHRCDVRLRRQDLGEFSADWARKAKGELKLKEKRYETLRIAAMRGNPGINADERAAIAQAAVEVVEPGLAEDIERLAGKVEEYKTLNKTIELRSKNTRSILSAHKEALKTERYVPQCAGARATIVLGHSMGRRESRGRPTRIRGSRRTTSSTGPPPADPEQPGPGDGADRPDVARSPLGGRS